MGDDEDGPAVFLLQLHEFHHEQAGIDAFVRAVAEVGQVINNDNFALEFEGGAFDVLQDLVFVVFQVQTHRVDFCPIHLLWEAEEGAGFLVGVAQLELLF